MTSDVTTKLAVLIDADNAQYSIIGVLLAEIEKYGRAHLKRAYGDWTNPNLKGWNNELHKESIIPIQQFAYTPRKNATDSAMIIDAMDLLYQGHYDAFCLISSDSDFTPLATRIHESGLMVYGFGERKTPQAFVDTCDKFIYTEDLRHASGLVSHATKADVIASHNSIQPAQEDGHLATQQQEKAKTSCDNSGWARLSDVDEHLTTEHPDFSASAHGYHDLSSLITDLPDYDVESRLSQTDKPPELYVRKRKTFSGSAQV
jgi:uncharacterized LabA/DUF88 family protein